MTLLRADLTDAIKRLFEEFFPLFVVLVVLALSTLKRIFDVLRRGRHPETARPGWKEEVRRYLETLEGRRTEPARVPSPRAPAPPQPRMPAPARPEEAAGSWLAREVRESSVSKAALLEPAPAPVPAPPRRGRWLTPGDARRAIVLREVLGPPLAFRPLTDPMER
jgi:hypothetical protein